MDYPPPTITGKEEAIILFTAENREGRPFYAYIKLTLQKLAEFYDLQANDKPVDLNRLGDVLETGWGHEPDPAVQQRIIDTYEPLLK